MSTQGRRACAMQCTESEVGELGFIVISCQNISLRKVNMVRSIKVDTTHATEVTVDDIILVEILKT